MHTIYRILHAFEEHKNKTLLSDSSNNETFLNAIMLKNLPILDHFSIVSMLNILNTYYVFNFLELCKKTPSQLGGLEKQGK